MAAFDEALVRHGCPLSSPREAGPRTARPATPSLDPQPSTLNPRPAVSGCSPLEDCLHRGTQDREFSQHPRAQHC